MANPRPTKAELEKRRAEVARLALNRVSQGAIAEQLGISQPTVCRDMKKIMAAWRAEYTGALDKIKIREIAECDEMERQVIADALSGQITKARGIELRVKLKERKARYMGIDAPTRIKDETPGDWRLAILKVIEKVEREEGKESGSKD